MNRAKNSKRGISLGYATVLMVAVVGFISLSIKLTRGESGPGDLPRSSAGATIHSQSNLLGAAAMNSPRSAWAMFSSPGAAMKLDDLEFSLLDANDSRQDGAIRVTRRRTLARDAARPTFAEALVGRSIVDAESVSTAMRWLTGMPGGPDSPRGQSKIFFGTFSDIPAAVAHTHDAASSTDLSDESSMRSLVLRQTSEIPQSAAGIFLDMIQRRPPTAGGDAMSSPLLKYGPSASIR